jgi:hypothetical protein
MNRSHPSRQKALLGRLPQKNSRFAGQRDPVFLGERVAGQQQQAEALLPELPAINPRGHFGLGRPDDRVEISCQSRLQQIAPLTSLQNKLNA